MATTRWCGLAIYCLLLLSCANLGAGHHAGNWPQLLPPLQYFQRSYQSDPHNQVSQSEQEYLDWVISFYQGSLLYPTGWLDVEAAILTIATPQERRLEYLRLRDLGALIAAEWSKHNAVRRIDNRLLSLWGSMLQLAPAAEQLSRYIEVIGADIEQILQGTLDPAEINPRRYEELLDIELFDDF